MEHKIYTEYSRYLGKPMTWQVYGTKGKICIAFAPQNGTYHDFSDFGMVEELRPWIEAGKLMVVCAASSDEESWSAEGGDGRKRSEHQESYYNYIVRELVPRARELNPDAPEKMMVTGCSMGAAHSGIFMFRRPDLFDTCIALSGFYKASFFFGDYMDDLVFVNSPIDFLPKLPKDDPKRALYAQSKMYFCIGQGAYEEGLLESTRELDTVLKAEGIDAFVDVWGWDVNHDWPWWKKQIVYFMGMAFGPAEQ